jgi:hypothetical protein
MKKLRHHLIGVDQGDVVLFSDFQNDGEMWTGEGPRRIARSVTFSEPFLEPPAVSVSMTMWDIADGANARADVSAEEVTAQAFEIVFRTWGDTRVARVRVGWTAVGELADEDHWDIR